KPPPKLLPYPARDRRHQQYLVAILERIRSAPKEANVFLIHINIQEPPRLPRFIPQMGLQVGELLVEFREQLTEIRSRAHDARCPSRKPPQSRRNLNGDAHKNLPGQKPVTKMMF